MSDSPISEPVPDLRHPHAMTLSDKSVVKVTIAQAVIVCGLVASGAIAWYAEKDAREAHEKNTHIHLDEHFGDTHGAPAGQNDIAAMAVQYTRAMDALQSEVKRLEEYEATAAQHEQDRKPRWRP